MPIRSARLAHLVFSVATFTEKTICVVPSGRTWIVKHVAVQNSSSPRNVYLVLRSGGVACPVHSGVGVATFTVEELKGLFLVLEQGDELFCYHDGAGSAAISVTVHGADLVGLAP